MVKFVALLSCIVFAGVIEDLKPGEWYEVPNSNLTRVAPSGYSANVMAPWSGGAFDTKRDRLIVWGGGHGDYVGNEIYVFDLNTLQWSRLNNPSNPPAKDVAYAADGGPCSRHTYNYIQYLPTIDKFASFGGAGFWQSGQTGTSHTDAFDFDSLKWSALADVPSRAYGIGAFSAVDASTGRAWQHGAGGKMLIMADFNPTTNTWTTHGTMWTEGENDFSYNLTAAIDTVRKKFVAIGSRDVWIYPTDSSGTLVGKTLVCTGDTEIVNTASPGFEYDPVADCFVAWSGGANVYSLDMDSKIWTKHLPAATNTVTPTTAAGNGTFGRFRYSPAKNIYVTVNSITGNVYLYRFVENNNGTGTKTKRQNHLQQLSLYPNPANKNASVIISGLTASYKTIEIYSLNGKLMQTIYSGSPAIKPSIVWNPAAELTNGAYLVKITGDKYYNSKMIVLTR
jgi:hypothetical protein